MRRVCVRARSLGLMKAARNAHPSRDAPVPVFGNKGWHQTLRLHSGFAYTLCSARENCG